MQDRSELTRQLKAEGWTVLTDEGFIGLVGPFFQKGEGADLSYRFPTEDRHHNLRGVLQGGAMMTFADRVMGITARAAAKAPRSATVHLDVHFIDAVQIGELVETSPVVVRAAKQLVFMSAELTVGSRTVALATGIWKILAPPAKRPE
jgi:acyl-coenzyme A thioesterase PaaI-like protein